MLQTKYIGISNYFIFVDNCNSGDITLLDELALSVTALLVC